MRAAAAEFGCCKSPFSAHEGASSWRQAHKAAARLIQIDPTFRVSNLKHLLPIHQPEDLAGYEEGLRKAGLPE